MDFTDERWALIELIIQVKRRSDGCGRPPKPARAVLDGIFWILRTSTRWQGLPGRYSPYQTCHLHFQ